MLSEQVGVEGAAPVGIVPVGGGAEPLPPMVVGKDVPLEGPYWVIVCVAVAAQGQSIVRSMMVEVDVTSGQSGGAVSNSVACVGQLHMPAVLVVVVVVVLGFRQAPTVDVEVMARTFPVGQEGVTLLVNVPTSGQLQMVAGVS